MDWTFRWRCLKGKSTQIRMPVKRQSRRGKTTHTRRVSCTRSLAGSMIQMDIVGTERKWIIQRLQIFLRDKGTPLSLHYRQGSKSQHCIDLSMQRMYRE